MGTVQIQRIHEFSYPKIRVLAAKEEVFMLVENQAPTTEETISNVLACVKKHKLGTTYLAKPAKDLHEVSNKEYLGSSVASHVRALVELSKSKLDQKSVTQKTATSAPTLKWKPRPRQLATTVRALRMSTKRQRAATNIEIKIVKEKRTTTRYVYLFLSLIHWRQRLRRLQNSLWNKRRRF